MDNNLQRIYSSDGMFRIVHYEPFYSELLHYDATQEEVQAAYDALMAEVREFMESYELK